MNIQSLITNSKYEHALQDILSNVHVSFEFSKTIESFIENSMERRPEIFIIQNDSESILRILDVIKDIRILFGSYPTILIVGEKLNKKVFASLITEGIDQFIAFPFDKMLIEDFIHKKTLKNHCRPFLYRHVPSGESAINIKLKVFIKEINVKEVFFNAHELIAKGTIFSINLSQLLRIPSFSVFIKVLSSEKIENNQFSYLGEFQDLSDDLKKQLVFSLDKI